MLPTWRLTKKNPCWMPSTCFTLTNDFTSRRLPNRPFVSSPPKSRAHPVKLIYKISGLIAPNWGSAYWHRASSTARPGTQGHSPMIFIHLGYKEELASSSWNEGIIFFRALKHSWFTALLLIKDWSELTFMASFIANARRRIYINIVFVVWSG